MYLGQQQAVRRQHVERVPPPSRLLGGVHGLLELLPRHLGVSLPQHRGTVLCMRPSLGRPAAATGGLPPHQPLVQPPGRLQRVGHGSS